MRYGYKNGLVILSEWAKKEGFKEVLFDHNDTSLIKWVKDSLNEPLTIKIEGKYSYEEQTYILLHELGHHQLRKRWDKFNKLLPVLAFAEELHHYNKIVKYKRGLSYNISCLEEEFKAWEEGYKLGIKLGIKINDIKWNKLKSKCLISYIRYYGNKKN
jgi:hypothetical protein